MSDPVKDATPCEDMSEFRKVFDNSKFVVVITGAGMSAESGIATFSGGKGGIWRGTPIQDLLVTSMFKENPSIIWEMHHFVREHIQHKLPNAGHECLAEIEKRFEENGKKLVIITQNVDELHRKAGSKNVVELHGSLFRTQCMECGDIADNYDSPICPALLGKGEPEEGIEDACIPPELLPRCARNGCNGLLRPDCIWYDEDPTPKSMEQSNEWLEQCDLCLIIGTAAKHYPVDGFGPMLASKGIPVAEFNIAKTNSTKEFQFYINGPCGTTLPAALL